MSPTPAGEGKTTMSIGLAQGMNKIGKKTTVVLREPSLGPVFGMKGGAAGGGYSQVLPMEDINLHFTGDFSAIEKANNLLAALIDNNIQSKSRTLDIDPRTVAWKRVMDMNDRSLRNIITGLGGMGQGIPTEAGFNITAASEIMAILCLSKDLEDLKKRIGNIFVGFTTTKRPVYARELNAQGAMAALLKDAIKPNLVQTIEATPAIIHGGPFANIAQGTNSVIATKMGLSLSDFVVTEAGFGADLGAEKFLDIKCRAAGLSPNAVVLIATIRALKFHGGVDLKSINEANPDAVKRGLPNLEKHIENIKKFSLPPVVAINKFTTDTDEEIAAVAALCSKLDVPFAVADVWGKGGAGTTDLAEKVAETAENFQKEFTPIYPLNISVKEKIETIAREIYGASGVEFGAQAEKDISLIDHVAHLCPAQAAGVCALLGLDTETTYQAIQQALHVSVSTRQSRKGEISSWKAYVPGHGAKLAIEAVDRAMRGEKSPSPIYEGEDSVIAWILDGPDANYTIPLPEPGEEKRAILETYTKEHSAEYQSQALIDLAARMRENIKDFSDIESILIETSHHTHYVIGTGSNDPQKFDPYATRETLDHSIMYIFAVALEDGTWHHEKSYAPSRAQRPETIELWKKISTVEKEKWTKLYHDEDRSIARSQSIH